MTAVGTTIGEAYIYPVLDGDASMKLQVHPVHSLASRCMDLLLLKPDTASEVEHCCQPQRRSASIRHTVCAAPDMFVSFV